MSGEVLFLIFLKFEFKQVFSTEPCTHLINFCYFILSQVIRLNDDDEDDEDQDDEDIDELLARNNDDDDEIELNGR